MKNELTALGSSERVMHSLRRMYGERGYLQFKMSKFERYDLYMQNRDFLIGENIISFTDMDGSLLALKPDVTLSIIKNAKDHPGTKEKVFYNENVYRISGSTKRFKEIMQMGLECIGDIDSYDVCETVGLAAASLAEIDANFVLDISHMGFVGALLDEAGIFGEARGEILSYIAGKNAHETARMLEKFNTPQGVAEKILNLMSLRVPLSEAVTALAPLAVGEGGAIALYEIGEIAAVLGSEPNAEKIYFDTSVMNDMNYYGGVVFRGFISGISEGVLSGGRYDELMRRMGKNSKAVGFALYLDLIEELLDSGEEYDVDVLLVYDEKLDTGRVYRRVKELVGEGFSVSAQRTVPDGIRYRRLERMEA